MKKYIELFWTFFKIGLFTFGGGYAMISFIHKETVEKKNWITDDDMNNIIVVSESTPGPISINASTFIGYKVGKFLGALISVLGVVIPSFIIIIFISIFLNYYKETNIIKYAFEGIRAAIIILMTEAIIQLTSKQSKNALFYSLLISSFILNFFFKINSFLIMIFGFIIAIIREFFSSKKKVNNND